MKQFKAKWITHHENTVEADHNQTINHILIQHNALIDYLEENQERMGSPEMEYLQHQTDFPNPPKIGVEEMIENIVAGVAEYPHGRLAMAVDLRDQLKTFATTIYQQGVLSERERCIKVIEQEHFRDCQPGENYHRYQRAQQGADYIRRKIIKRLTPLT